MKKVIVIGSGFAGMSAAAFMAKAGWQVTVLEQHGMPGGRARQFSADGFTFDMGPSWYWMPDVFEHFFASFGKQVSDYYTLQRLNPSYRIYWPDGPMDIPADYGALGRLFESLEPGSSHKLNQFMQEAAYKYQVGIHKLVFKPGQSLTEFWDKDLMRGIFKLDVFTSIQKHIHKYFAHPKLRQLLEFPVLFLGALPQDTPALYSLMNYADIKLGTWYPQGGMYQIAAAMHQLAEEQGVTFVFNTKVTGISITGSKVRTVAAMDTTTGVPVTYEADAVISGADYHFTETQLLEPAYRSYSDSYWNKRVMAPSSLLYYVGINKKIDNLLHHSLFFDTPFDVHGKEIYSNPAWPSNPLFYVSATSVTDNSVAPPGCENLFFLIPVAAGLQGDTEELRDKYFQAIISRFEQQIGQEVAPHIVYNKSFAVSDFVSEYNSFKGNAYGLANTLRQTAILKPACHSKKVSNLFYTGQLTVPGPGVPPSLISGEVVAKEVIKLFR